MTFSQIKARLRLELAHEKNHAVTFPAVAERKAAKARELTVNDCQIICLTPEQRQALAALV